MVVETSLFAGRRSSASESSNRVALTVWIGSGFTVSMNCGCRLCTGDGSVDIPPSELSTTLRLAGLSATVSVFVPLSVHAPRHADSTSAAEMQRLNRIMRTLLNWKLPPTLFSKGPTNTFFASQRSVSPSFSEVSVKPFFFKVFADPKLLSVFILRTNRARMRRRHKV